VAHPAMSMADHGKVLLSHDHPPHTVQACLALSFPPLQPALSLQLGMCLDHHSSSADMRWFTYVSSKSMIDDWLTAKTCSILLQLNLQRYLLVTSFFHEFAIHCNVFPMQQWWYDRNGYTLCCHNDVQILSPNRRCFLALVTFTAGNLSGETTRHGNNRRS